MKLPSGSALCPAYGRDYKSKSTVIADFASGKDFSLGQGGPYCSIRDCLVGCRVELRYKRLEMVTMYTVTGNEPGFE